MATLMNKTKRMKRRKKKKVSSITIEQSQFQSIQIYDNLIQDDSYQEAVNFAMNYKGNNGMFGKHCLIMWFMKNKVNSDLNYSDFIFFLAYTLVYYFLLGPFTNIFINCYHEDQKPRYMARYLGFYGWNKQVLYNSIIWIFGGLSIPMRIIFHINHIPSLLLMGIFFSVVLRCLFVSVSYLQLDLDCKFDAEDVLNMYNHFIAENSSYIRKQLLTRYEYGVLYSYSDRFTKNGQYNFYNEVYDILNEKYHANFSKLYLKFLDVAHPYIKSKYVKWVHDIIYPTASPNTQAHLKEEISQKYFVREGFIPLMSIFYHQFTASIKGHVKLMTKWIPLFFLVRLFLEPFLLWQLNIFKLDEFFTGDQERGRKYAEVAYLLISIYVQKMIQYDIFVVMIRAILYLDDKQRLIQKTQNLTNVQLVRENMRARETASGARIDDFIGLVNPQIQKKLLKPAVYKRKQKMPCMNFMDPNTLASFGMQRRLIWSYAKTATDSFQWLFTSLILSIIASGIGVLLQYLIQDDDYVETHVLPYLLIVYLPFYVMPKLAGIIVYFLYCARINFSFVVFDVCLNELRLIIASMLRHIHNYDIYVKAQIAKLSQNPNNDQILYHDAVKKMYSHSKIEMYLIKYLNKTFRYDNDRKRCHLKMCQEAVDQQIMELRLDAAVDQMTVLAVPMTFEFLSNVITLLGLLGMTGVAFYIHQFFKDQIVENSE